MNERINGIWWKARIGYNNQSCDPEVIERFAELIVRECVTKIALEVMNNSWIDDAVKNTYEHFGLDQ